MTIKKSFAAILRLGAICDELAAFRAYYEATDKDFCHSIDAARKSIIDSIIEIEQLGDEPYEKNAEIIERSVGSLNKSINLLEKAPQPNRDVFNQLIKDINSAAAALNSPEILALNQITANDKDKFFALLSAAVHDLPVV